MLPNNTHIGRVRLRVADLPRALAFYCDLLGWQQTNSEPGMAFLSAGSDQPVRIELVERPGAPRQPMRSAGLYHIAIRVPDRAALGMLLQRLMQANYPLQGGADHLVSEAIYLADADGNGVELYRDRPRPDWPRRGDTVQMSSDPLDARGILREAAQAERSWQGIPEQTDIGHVHVQVSDLAQAERFFSKIIGLDVTQRDYPGALFMAAGGYHHHVGANIWSSRGAPPAPEDAAGLAFFELVISGQDARQQALQRLEESGLTLAPHDGQLLARSPDGIQVLI
jgi:catechol 2,3-dioxygenase